MKCKYNMSVLNLALEFKVFYNTAYKYVVIVLAHLYISQVKLCRRRS